MSELILASTSIYRRQLLQRLQLPFSCQRPEVDEAARVNEPPRELAVRLAREKALAVAARHLGARVIGSDQVADLGGQALGKPGTVAAACDQLRAMSGQTVRFHTAVTLALGTHTWNAIDTTDVVFRTLDAAEIERYVQAELPLDCAGSFKCEGLGITLFEAINTCDPTALIGLPLIAVSGLLRQAGQPLP